MSENDGLSRPLSYGEKRCLEQQASNRNNPRAQRPETWDDHRRDIKSSGGVDKSPQRTGL
jgi:hypothetical protein